jgi:hypothetical protein
VFFVMIYNTFTPYTFPLFCVLILLFSSTHSSLLLLLNLLIPINIKILNSWCILQLSQFISFITLLRE